jgi:hypothetical protein
LQAAPVGAPKLVAVDNQRKASPAA